MPSREFCRALPDRGPCNTRLLDMPAGDVMMQVNVCVACEWIEPVGDVRNVQSLIGPHSDPV